jgi:intracellular sulfur oxidation DsrE/DsrF family protein
MSKKVLNVIESSYRATLEEQDDTAIWLTHAMRAAGAEMTVLLRGNAVNYAVSGQDASGLAFGDRRQTNPPRIDEQVRKLPSAGVEVLVIQDDLAKLGADPADLVDGVKLIPHEGLPKLFSNYDQVWRW